MLDDDERLARQEAYWLIKEFGAEAPLYAAMKAEKAIEQKDFGRCARLEAYSGYWPIPTPPSLRSQNLWAQSLLLPSIRFSNLRTPPSRRKISARIESVRFLLTLDGALRDAIEIDTSTDSLQQSRRLHRQQR